MTPAQMEAAVALAKWWQIAPERSVGGERAAQILGAAVIALAAEIERMAKVAAWAESRIEDCRRVERKLGVGNLSPRSHSMPQGTIEAWTERQTLQTVLTFINGGHVIEPVTDALSNLPTPPSET